jgi:hypothetical protein
VRLVAVEVDVAYWGAGEDCAWGDGGLFWEVYSFGGGGEGLWGCEG